MKMNLTYVKMHCWWNTWPQDGIQTAESLLYSRLERQIKQANIIAIYYVYEIIVFWWNINS